MNSPTWAWRHAVHTYDDKWYPHDWILPVMTMDEGTAMYSLNPYHDDPDNPELMGLFVCCCPLALYTLGLHFGKLIAAPGVEYWLQSGAHIANGVEKEVDIPLFYFILCDPERPLQVRFLPLPTVQATAVLRKQAPLADYFHLSQEYTY